MSTHHQKGQWLHFSDVKNRVDQHEIWIILDKKHWLSPATTHYSDEHTLLNSEQLIEALVEAFKEDSRPRVVCPMQQDHLIMREAERHFITPDHWPFI